MSILIFLSRGVNRMNVLFSTRAPATAGPPSYELALPERRKPTERSGVSCRLLGSSPITACNFRASTIAREELAIRGQSGRY
jgi:hypothetical protein